VPTTKNVKVRQDHEGDDLYKTLNAALKALDVEVATHEGFALAGPVKVKHTTAKSGDQYVTASGKVSDVPASGDMASVKARHNVDPAAGITPDAVATAALKDLREKAQAEGFRVTGNMKVSYTETKKGDVYVTASAKGLPIDGVIAVGRDTLNLVDALGKDAPIKDVLAALKPLRTAVKDAHKYI
jgi:hypothetical protein